ncbi:hypothetical protein KNHN1_57070 (plasmid) [Pseudomonas guariconensis]|nr:hypothetical protein PPUJ21368_11290 [Pseudomonas putida]
MPGQPDEVQAGHLICHAVSLQNTTLLVANWKLCQKLQVRPETGGEDQRVDLVGGSIWPDNAFGQYLLEHRFALEPPGIQGLPILAGIQHRRALVTQPARVLQPGELQPGVKIEPQYPLGEEADLLASRQQYLRNACKLIGNLNRRVRRADHDDTLASKGLRRSISRAVQTGP